MPIQRLITLSLITLSRFAQVAAECGACIFSSENLPPLQLRNDGLAEFFVAGRAQRWPQDESVAAF